jgi:hypothetical protein
MQNLTHVANKGDKTPEKTIIRIKNMLEMHERATTKGEAMAAAAAVQRELTKHNLSLSEVQLFEVQLEEPVEEQWLAGDDYGFTRSRRRVAWIENLATFVARAHFCKIIVSTGSNRIAFVGRRSNREVCVKSFAYLVNVAKELADIDTEEYKQTFVAQYNWEKIDVRSFRNSFFAGFVSAIEMRFLKEERDIEDEQKELEKRETLAKKEVQWTNIREEVFEQLFDRMIDEELDLLALAGVPDFDADAVVKNVEAKLEKIVYERMTQIPIENASTGLIRLEKEREAVDDWFNSRKWGKAKGVGYRSSHNSAGYSRGTARGSSVSTSGNVLR